MTERRYTEEEVAEILDRATEVRTERGRSLATSEGLTLAELKEIGQEAGIPSDMIVWAAGQVDRPAQADPDVRLLGARIGVGRTVHLGRKLTDAEWNRLVVDLRETFNAVGTVREQGAFRTWSNGNLQALLEPTENGERLRLKTVKASGQIRIFVGAAMLGALVAVALAAMVVGGERATEMIASIAPLGLIGAFFIGSAYLQLPRWAETREIQMEGLAQRLVESVGEG